MSKKWVFIIGIVGGSGSGKTLFSNTIIKELENHLLDRITVVSEDRYYKDWGRLIGLEEAKKVNYDHPNAFDHELLKSDLHKLINGQDVEIAHYDYATHSRDYKNLEKISSKNLDVIILEGIMLFNDPDILNMMDFKIYMDTPSDLSFIRRLLRDQKERGRTVDCVIEQYLETVRPMHIKFVEPSKRKADIIVPDGAQNKTVIDIIHNKIKHYIEEQKGE